MGKSLVIVESPTKAHTLSKYLGKGFLVKASVGHIKDLPKSTLGVDLKDNFKPSYVVLPGKVKVVEEIQKAASLAEQIYLACDPDREGEAIAWHLAEEIQKKGVKKGVKEKPIYRVLVTEITQRGVQEAMRNPGKLDKNLYEAQQARRILDRLVGYQISPILWEKVRRGLSAGRVQSVAVRLICEREAEVRNFKSEEYWTVDLLLEGGEPPPFWARVVSFKGKKIEVKNREEADRILGGLKNRPLRLDSITRKERKRHAPAPFITSRLQQDAAQKLGFSPQKTMMVAQQLYEGIDLKEKGPVGLITYMRTDSTRVSQDAISSVRAHINMEFGQAFLPEKPNFYKNKKAAQDAHEAIRPTSMDLTPEEVRTHLKKDQFRLYELIWKRFVASQMSPALFDQTTFDIRAGDYALRATGSQVKFQGFLAVYQVDQEVEGREGKEGEGEEEPREGILPSLSEGTELKVTQEKPEQHFTEPPPRYNEASLIRELEEKGIGRPSTYAAIVSTILTKGYVEKDANRFTPTRLGTIVNELLVDSFPEILNVQFTAQMEEELDEVEEGRRSYIDALKDFYVPFEKTLALAKTRMKDVKRQEIPTDVSCKQCGSPMVIKWGRRGEFLACSNYPTCKNTGEFQRGESGEITLEKKEVTGEFCQECGSQMVIKKGRFGRFLACSNYPQCKASRALSIGIQCPRCAGALVERRSRRRGRLFFGCSTYPKCNFASWDRPIGEPCPQCGSPFVVLKAKKTGDEIRCPAKGCSYARPPEA